MSDIESSNRARKFAYPRQISMFLCRELTDLSLPKIGEYFGGRDHTTVIHACNKISEEFNKSEECRKLIISLKEEIQG